MRQLTLTQRRYGLGLLLVAAPFVWLLVASYLYCRWSRHADLFVAPYAQWLEVAPYWHEVGQKTKALIVGSALVPLVPPGLGLRLWWLQQQKKLTPTGDGSVRPIVRGPTDNLGHADWLSRSEMLRLFPGPSGMLIGAASPEPESPLLVDTMEDGPTHSLVFSPPGGGKSTTAVTRMWLWPGSMVVFDPSVELGPIIANALRKERGYTVYSVGIRRDGFNILDWIDVTHPEAEVHIRAVVGWCYEESAGAALLPKGQAQDPFWPMQGRNLVTCLLLHLLYMPDDPRVSKTLKTLRAGICTPEDAMQKRLETINATSPSPMARDLAAGLMAAKGLNTFSSIYIHAFGSTSWLSTEAYADLVSGNSFRTADVLSGKVAIFIQLTLLTLDATPAIGRAVLGALLNPVYQAEGVGVEERVLYLIDEAWIFGAMKEINLCYTTGRKYSGTMCTMWASEAIFRTTWGEAGGALLAACSWISHSPTLDPDEAERVSVACGEYAVLTYSEGSNTGTTKQQGSLWGSRNTGDTTNVSEQVRRLIKRDEVMRTPRGVMFVQAADAPHAIKCYTAPYWRYEAIAELMDNNRFKRSRALVGAVVGRFRRHLAVSTAA